MWEWSDWDCIELRGPLTLAELLDFYKGHLTGLDAEGVSCGSSLIYFSLLGAKKIKARLPVHIARLVQVIGTYDIPSTIPHIMLEITGPEGAPEIPKIKYFISEQERREHEQKQAAAAAAANSAVSK